MKWIMLDGMVVPLCPRCGAYPLLKKGKDEYGHYLLQCYLCGEVVAVKTNPDTLAMKALDRRWRK
jgi:uncharacterized Zn finger protein